LEQFHESCLLKITIRCKGLREPFLGHDDEGDTVSETPVLIEAITVQFPSCGLETLTGRENCKEGQLTKTVDELHRAFTMRGCREGVCDLQQDKFCGQQCRVLSAQRLHDLLCLSMQVIVLVE